ncbi:MAG TPA: lipoprotein [Steroidobacter sp.]|jgi:predicted small lipoprotein YifL
MKESWLKMAAGALLAMLVAGCGLKGPLYPPDDGREEVSSSRSTPRSAVKRRTPLPPAPQAQKEAREEERASSEQSSQTPSPAESAPSGTTLPEPDR